MADEAPAAATETPVADPAETATPPIEAPTGDPKPTEEAPAEGEPKPEGEAAKSDEAKLTEDAIKLAAAKYAKDTLTAANRTMAAARRAQAKAEAMTREVTQVREVNKIRDEWFGELKTNPFSALLKTGLWGSIKEMVDAGIAAGGEPKQPSIEDKFAALERERKEEREALAKERKAADRARDVAAVSKHLATDPERWDLVTTDLGQTQLWEAIDHYVEQYGTAPDEAVLMMADEVEKALASQVTKSRKFRPVPRQDATKPGATSVDGQAAASTKNSGKTLSNIGSGAPSTNGLSLDPDERRKQVNAAMRAAGEL